MFGLGLVDADRQLLVSIVDGRLFGPGTGIFKLVLVDRLERWFVPLFGRSCSTGQRLEITTRFCESRTNKTLLTGP